MTDHDGSDEQRRPFCVVGQACSRDRMARRASLELEAENGELTAASKRMYDKWMACFDAARKAEADRDATIQRVRELWQRIDSATTINVIRQSLADELLAALDATGDNERTDQ